MPQREPNIGDKQAHRGTMTSEMNKTRIPTVDFSRIREHGKPPSQAAGFEELSSMLIQRGAVEWPAGAEFDRFGNPDGGREGRGRLANGDVWAWQSKYLFAFNSAAVAQVTESIKRALLTEPRLSRYYVILPIDLAAGDTQPGMAAQAKRSRKSAFTKWQEASASWRSLALKRGMEVEFQFLGAHELLTALTEDRNAGQARYWFDLTILSQEQQQRQLDQAKARAGSRYSPQLHVDMIPDPAVEAVCRTQAFLSQWQNQLADVRQLLAAAWQAPDGLGDAFDHAVAECQEALKDVDAGIEHALESWRGAQRSEGLDELMTRGLDRLSTIEELLLRNCLNEVGRYAGTAATLNDNVTTSQARLSRGLHMAQSVAVQSADSGRLVVIGRAGIGKTHQLLDLYARRTTDGKPTAFLFGQDFESGSLSRQIGLLSELGETTEEVLAVLSAAGEASGCVALLIIDAVNESASPERWIAEMRSLAQQSSRYSHLAFVVSCRREFVDEVVGDVGPRTEFHGFQESTGEAVRNFTKHFGLETPSFPVLNPEFGNPLYLKLACEALSTLGAQRFPLGAAGLKTICDSFLESVDARLSQANRCDYDKKSQLARQAAFSIAQVGGTVPYETAREITQSLLPTNSHSRSLLRGLVAEGVLIEVGRGRSITFGYQRIGDYFRAQSLLMKSDTALDEWLASLGTQQWREAGTLEALAALLPETQERELIDACKDSEGRVTESVINAFIEGLVVRSPESCTPRTKEIVDQLATSCDYSHPVRLQLLRLACVPSHPLNAEFLHERLLGQELAARDRTWSISLIGTLDSDWEDPIDLLVKWAWPRNLEGREDLTNEVALLAILTLAWCLSATDRRVRDSATKAIVSVAERQPPALAEALDKFHSINDPYILERLCAAACGVALRVPQTAPLLAAQLQGLLRGSWPDHLLTRDYIRRVYEVAHERGWSGPTGEPPYESQWSANPTAYDEVEKLASEPESGYSRLWYSLTGLTGDFGRYVVESALSHIYRTVERDIKKAVLASIFARVIELGWSPEVFEEVDGGLQRWRDEPIERVGKKYQWIAFYEITGKILDKEPLRPNWGEESARPYAYPEEVVRRDIDPTILTREPLGESHSAQHWMIKSGLHEKAFIGGDQPPSNTAALPDPLDVIYVTDDQGRPWLNLASNPRWQDMPPPEVQALGTSYTQVWMQLHAYLVPTASLDAMSRWCIHQDWYGHWMPEYAEIHNLLLSTHPEAPEWSCSAGETDVRRTESPPADLMQCAAWYGGSDSSLDHSDQEAVRGFVPARPLAVVLGLDRGVDFVWRAEGKPLVQDASFRMGGPPALLLACDALIALTQANLTVFWTVLMNQELVGGDWWSGGEDDYQWISASGSYALSNGSVKRLSSKAKLHRRHADMLFEQEVAWPTKEAQVLRHGYMT